jgi:hypothetical protein
VSKFLDLPEPRFFSFDSSDNMHDADLFCFYPFFFATELMMMLKLRKNIASNIGIGKAQHISKGDKSLLQIATYLHHFLKIAVVQKKSVLTFRRLTKKSYVSPSRC